MFLLERGQIGQRHLDPDDLDVAQRVRGAFNVRDVVVAEAAHDHGDRIRFPDVRQKRIPEALTAGSAADQTGNVDEAHARRDDLL